MPSKTFAQLPPVLSLQLKGGASSLDITGDAGSACTVQFATNLSADTAWLTLSNFTLLGSPFSVVDPGSATRSAAVLSRGDFRADKLRMDP